VPIVDVLHLTVIVAALAAGAWSLVAFRTTMPRGRFAVFGLASASALFGCAALSGEVGVLPPTAWFAVVVAVIIGAIVAAQRIAKAGSPQT
jgi:hypothetical protein